MTDKTVVQALSAVMEDVRAVGKDSRNTDQNYKFRGIDAVMNAVGPALRRHGVVVVPNLVEATYRDVLTSREKRSRECTVKVRYVFYGPAGDSIECVTPGESMDFGDKGAAKAMSVAYRIALLQALCLPTDDPDPDHGSYERATDQAPPVDHARAARQSLAAAAEKAGLDLSEVSGAYLAKTGRALRTDTDTDAIKAFESELVLNVTDWLQSQEKP
jgi:hypothetical protein